MMDTTYPADLEFGDNWGERQKKVCPFIIANHAECYSSDLNSQTIESVLYYCGGNYTRCKFYEGLSSDVGKISGKEAL